MNTDYIRNFLEILPYIHKKILREVKPDLITRQELHLMHMIKKKSDRPMSEYATKMAISKSNLSKLMQDLIEKGYIVKAQDEQDRRVYNINLTDSGEEFLKTTRTNIEKEVARKFECLSESDIEELNRSFETIRKIIDKIE